MGEQRADFSERLKEAIDKAFEKATKSMLRSFDKFWLETQTPATKTWDAEVEGRMVCSDYARNSEFNKVEVPEVVVVRETGYALKVCDGSPERALEEDTYNFVRCVETRKGDRIRERGTQPSNAPIQWNTPTGIPPEFSPHKNSHFNCYDKLGKGTDVGGYERVGTENWGSYKDSGSGGGPGHGCVQTLDIPRFDRNDSDGWIRIVEQLLYAYRVSESELLNAIEKAFVGDVLRWYQWENNRRPFHRWSDLKLIILRQFRSAGGSSNSVSDADGFREFGAGDKTKGSWVSDLQQNSQSGGGIVAQGDPEMASTWSQVHCNPQYPAGYYNTIDEDWRYVDTCIPSPQSAIQSEKQLNKNGFASIDTYQIDDQKTLGVYGQVCHHVVRGFNNQSQDYSGQSNTPLGCAPANSGTSVPACGAPLFSVLTQAAPSFPLCRSLAGLGCQVKKPLFGETPLIGDLNSGQPAIGRQFIGSKDILGLVKKAVREVIDETRTVADLAETVKTVGESAAEVFKTAAVEVYKETNEKEMSVFAASKAQSTVIDAENAVEVSRRLPKVDANLANSQGAEPEKNDGAEELSTPDSGSLAHRKERSYIQCLQRLGEYAEVVGLVLTKQRIDICLKGLQRSSRFPNEPTRVLFLSDVGKLLSILSAHRKLATVLVDSSDMQKLLKGPGVAQKCRGKYSGLFTTGSRDDLSDELSIMMLESIYYLGVRYPTFGESNSIGFQLVDGSLMMECRIIGDEACITVECLLDELPRRQWRPGILTPDKASDGAQAKVMAEEAKIGLVYVWRMNQIGESRGNNLGKDRKGIGSSKQTCPDVTDLVKRKDAKFRVFCSLQALTTGLKCYPQNVLITEYPSGDWGLKSFTCEASWGRGRDRSFDLEDKVVLWGRGNVMNSVGPSTHNRRPKESPSRKGPYQ